MRCLGAVFLLLTLLVAPAMAKEEFCVDSSPFRLAAVGDDLTHRLLTEPAAKAPKRGGEPDLRVETQEDLVLVSFSPKATFSPWLGAGLTYGEVEGVTPAEVRLGAGVGCALGEGLRLNLGWRVSTEGSRDLSDLNAWIEGAEERHRFSFGLEKSF